MRTVPVLAALVAAFAFAQEPEPEPARKPVPPQVGEAAPAFRLNDHEGEAVSIGGKSDKWTVLAFYPKAMTPG